MRFTPEDNQIIARCIQEVEARTQAEVVLIVRKRSGNYRDVSYLVGAGVMWFMFCFCLFSGGEIPAYEIPLPLAAIFWGVAWAVQNTKLGRWVTTEKRRLSQVRKSARAAWVERKMVETQSRMGILLFVSCFERHAEILVDSGAAAKLESAKLDEFRKLLDRAANHRRPARHLGSVLRTFGVYLGQVLPWDDSQGENPNELADHPDLESKEGEEE